MGIILSTICAAAVSVVKSLTVVELAVQGLKVLGNALMGIAKTFGLVKVESKVEDLGDKALQAEEEGIYPEKFLTYAEYVNAVEAFEVDPEKSKMIPEEKKVQKGIELTAGVTIERFPNLPVAEFFECVGKNPEYFTEPKIEEIGKLVMQDEEYLAEILNYIDGTEQEDSAIEKMIETLKNIEKNVNPDMSDRDALKNVLNIRK